MDRERKAGVGGLLAAVGSDSFGVFLVFLVFGRLKFSWLGFFFIFDLQRRDDLRPKK